VLQLLTLVFHLSKLTNLQEKNITAAI